MFFPIRFILTWLIWLVFSDKSRWRELLPTCLLASLLGSTTDHLMSLYTLWAYSDGDFPPPIIHIMDDWGIYLVVTYLFLQWLPKKQTYLSMARYVLLWSLATISIEWLHLNTGHMYYYKFWSLYISFFSDIVLFLLFYFFYRRFIAQSSYQGLTHAIEALGDIVLLLSLEGRVLECYSNWLGEHNFDPKKEVGKSVEEIDGITDVTVHYRAFEKIYSGQRATFKFKWFAPDGATYCFENTLSPVSNRQGRIIAMMGILNEVPLYTESKLKNIL